MRAMTQRRRRQAAISVLTLWLTLGAALAATPSAGERLTFDHAATSQKIVALTFDADMTPGMLRELKAGKVASWYNGKVIEALRQQQAPATLFLTGLWIETRRDQTARSRPVVRTRQSQLFVREAAARHLGEIYERLESLCAKPQLNVAT